MTPRSVLLAALLSVHSACATAPSPVTRVAVSEGPRAPTLAEAPPPPEGPRWERIREEAGIVVDRREVAGSPVIAFRGEGVVQASLVRVASVLVDVDRSPEWVDRVADARSLRRLSAVETVSYTHVRTPLVITDRDFVLHGKLSVAARRIVIQIHSVKDDAMPEGRYVRGEIIESSFVLTDEGGGATRVVAEIHADPKGALPKWLVNLFQKSWAIKTINSLRAQVKKPDVRDAPWLQELLTAALEK